MGFLFGFIMLLLYYTESNSASTVQTSTLLFKRGSRAPAALRGRDEESQSHHYPPSMPESGSSSETTKARRTNTDVFTWRNVNYTVSVAGNQRKLLDSVSGFVAPGKLTALMGESGAGKVRTL